MKTGKDLAEYAKSKQGTPYFFGSKMNTLTEPFMSTMHTMYPGTVTSTYITKARNKGQVGKINTDCSGLISAYTGNVLGSAQLYQMAYTRLSVKDYESWAEGVVCWRSGHVGVFFKDSGKYFVAEAKGIDYGTIISEFKPENWSKGLTFSWLKYDYEENVAGNATWKGTNPYKEPTNNIKRGAKGENVKWVQWELMEAGYSIEIDGDFGNITDITLRSYQKSTKLNIDGICGPETRKALKADTPQEAEVLPTVISWRFGIDVAKWQGEIKWDDVKKDGIQFAVLKVTQKNNSIEGSFNRNYTETKKFGIPIGVYRYVYAKSLDAAKKEAQGIIDALNGKQIEGHVWLDMEDSSILGIGKAALTIIINTEAELLKASGYQVGIYCNQDWYDHVLDSANLSKKYNFWIAKYGTNTGRDGWQNRKDNPEAFAFAWQYTSKAHINGINGDVDMDIIYNENTPPIEANNNSASHIQTNYKAGKEYTVQAACLNVRTKPSFLNGVVEKGEILSVLYRNTIVKNQTTMRVGDQIWMYLGLDKGIEMWACADNGIESYIV